MVGDGALVDDLAVLVEHAEGMLLVAEIKSDGDEWNFGSVELITALKRRRSLPSHLILFSSCILVESHRLQQHPRLEPLTSL